MQLYIVNGQCCHTSCYSDHQKEWQSLQWHNASYYCTADSGWVTITGITDLQFPSMSLSKLKEQSMFLLVGMVLFTFDLAHEKECSLHCSVWVWCVYCCISVLSRIFGLGGGEAARCTSTEQSRGSGPLILHFLRCNPMVVAIMKLIKALWPILRVQMQMKSNRLGYCKHKTTLTGDKIKLLFRCWALMIWLPLDLLIKVANVMHMGWGISFWVVLCCHVLHLCVSESR